MRSAPTSDFRIREFQATDLERVRWLFSRTPPWGRTYHAPEPLPGDLEDIPSNYPRGCFVALEDDLEGEALIGLTACAVVPDAELSALPEFIPALTPLIRIHWVSVAPERWGTGVGRRLTQSALEWARECGARYIVLETTPEQAAAVALYQSMGFLELGRAAVGRWMQVWLGRSAT